MQSIWAYHVFPSRSSSSLQTPQIRVGSSIAEKALATHSKGNIYRGEVETDKPIQKLVPTGHTASAICLSHGTEFRFAGAGHNRRKPTPHSGEDERHAVRIVLLRGESFQEIRNALTIEVTTTEN